MQLSKIYFLILYEFCEEISQPMFTNVNNTVLMTHKIGVIFIKRYKKMWAFIYGYSVLKTGRYYFRKCSTIAARQRCYKFIRFVVKSM